MFSILFLITAVVDFIVLIWAIRVWQEHRSLGILFAIAPLTLLWYDNLTIGMGRFLGEGDLLLAMNYVRFYAHYIGLPLTFMAIAFMGRQAEFKLFKNPLTILAFAALAAFFIYEDITLFQEREFYPNCSQDTLRYSTSVKEWTRCTPDAALEGQAMLPIPAFVLTGFMLAFGLAMWIRRDWKWLFLPVSLAFIFFAIPFRIGGGIFSNVGEPILSIALVATGIYIARMSREWAAEKEALS